MQRRLQILFFCCLFVVYQHSLVTLWQYPRAHTLLMALVLAVLPDLCLTHAMCLCSSLPIWVYSSHFLFRTLRNVRQESLPFQPVPCTRNATPPALCQCRSSSISLSLSSSSDMSFLLLFSISSVASPSVCKGVESLNTMSFFGCA